jgi:hypothetical protein
MKDNNPALVLVVGVRANAGVLVRRVLGQVEIVVVKLIVSGKSSYVGRRVQAAGRDRPSKFVRVVAQMEPFDKHLFAELVLGEYVESGGDVASVVLVGVSRVYNDAFADQVIVLSV